MNCDNCGGENILEISAKCSDMCILNYLGVEHAGYVPHDLPIGGGDYIKLSICFDCGKAQGIKEAEDPMFYIDRAIDIYGDEDEEEFEEEFEDEDFDYR